MKQSQSMISRPQIFRFLLTLCMELQPTHALEISQSTSFLWDTDTTACIWPLQHINATHIRGHKWSLIVTKTPSECIEQTIPAFLSSSLPFLKHNGITCSKGKHTFLSVWRSGNSAYRSFYRLKTSKNCLPHRLKIRTNPQPIRRPHYPAPNIHNLSYNIQRQPFFTMYMIS